MKTEIEKVGGRCDLRLYDGQEHGFFNYLAWSAVLFFRFLIGRGSLQSLVLKV